MPAGYEEWEWLPVTPKSTAALIAQAERRGAVKALRARSEDTRIRGDIGKPGQLEVWEYLSWWANKIEGGSDL